MGALGGFTASITNPASSTTGYGSGTVLLSESQTSGSTTNTCISTGSNTTASNSVSTADANTTCTAINLFGGQVAADPGVAVSSATVTVKNIGTINAATLTLSSSGCTQADNTAGSNTYFGTDTAFCSKVDYEIYDSTSGNCLVPAATGACPTTLSNSYNLSQFTTPVSLGALSAGGSETLVFYMQLDSAATNADQGLIATMPLTWTLSQ